MRRIGPHRIHNFLTILDAGFGCLRLLRFLHGPDQLTTDPHPETPAALHMGWVSFLEERWSRQLIVRRSTSPGRQRGVPQRTMVHSTNRTRQLTAVLPDRIGSPNGATISRTALVLRATPASKSGGARYEARRVREWHPMVARGLVALRCTCLWGTKAKVKAKGVFPAFTTLMNGGGLPGRSQPPYVGRLCRGVTTS